METFFKQIKQNFELNYFYSDSSEGIKTQIWIVLIANLLFTVIYKQIKEYEQFTTLVSMASNNLGSYVCLISLLKMREKLSATQRDIKRLRKEISIQKIGGLFENAENTS